MRRSSDRIDGHTIDREIYRVAGLLGVDPMPFSLRELNWMLETKTDLNRKHLECLLDAIYQSMANQMAQAKAMHTGRRVSPDEFYRSPKRQLPQYHEAIHQEGFSMMKALFVT